MCRLFVGADPGLWQSQTRSIRMAGMVTSVRLEKMFWSVLEDIAARDGMNVSQLIQTLYDESRNEGHDLGNFTSFLRVCCLRYLDLQRRQLIPVSGEVSLKSLATADVLELESRGA